MWGKRLMPAALIGAAMAIPLTGLGQGSAAAAPVVYIHVIQYSPAGPDVPVTTARLNGEWVLLTNTTSRPVSLTSWTLRDRANHVYRFPVFTLRAHASVRVHTGTGRNTATDVYWGHRPPASTSYVWNNTGYETAALRNASGRTVDSRAYTGRNVSGAAQATFRP